MALSLAHQSRIRHLYPQSDGKSDTIRPGSSSSASSATDWDSGHATVLRRQTQNQVIFLLSNYLINNKLFFRLSLDASLAASTNQTASRSTVV